MKFKKIVCLNFKGDELEESYWGFVDDLTDVRVLVDDNNLSKHNDADALLVKLGAKIPKETIDKLPNLKYIGMLGTGYGGIDTQYAASKGITLTNIADYATEAVAEFTIGVILEYFRDLAKARSRAKAGNYSDDFVGGEAEDKPFANTIMPHNGEIKDMPFGVIGLGHIGRRTAELVRAFGGANLSYWSKNRRSDAEAEGIKYKELDDLLSSSAIVTLNLAYNSETEGIINADRINKIKKFAVFINVSPMELIDFDALLERLKKDDMVFILDHSDEMSPEQLHALQPLNNVIVYPAIAYLTAEASLRKKDIYVSNIKNFLDGRATNKVN